MSHPSSAQSLKLAAGGFRKSRPGTWSRLPSGRLRQGLTERFKTPLAGVANIVTGLLHSYSYLLFVRSRLVGCVLLLVSFLDLNIGLAAILALLAALLFARLLGIKRDDPVHHVYTYNALIVGFAIGFLYPLSPLSLLITAGAAVLTVLVSTALQCLLANRLRLPVLNLPFVIVATIVYLASTRYDVMLGNAFHYHGGLNLSVIPPAVQGLLRAFGSLLFMPYDLCGILIALALLAFSRIAFFLAISSYYLGVLCLGLLTHDVAGAFHNVYAFNFILTGIALGGIFLIPARRSYLFAFIGVFVSILVLDAVLPIWSVFDAPVFTLPFNLVVLLFVYVLMQTGYPHLPLLIEGSPEASLATHLNFTRRFDRLTPKPFLPFSGRWKVYQAFDGEWTHKGIWKYAYDFVIEAENGLTYQNGDGRVEDYHCYGKPVLCPINGTVIAVCDSLKDNPIGEVDKHHNWGNYVIVYSPLGYYVELSHLQQQSLKVKVGETVAIGQVLAACGNSGYSPQPHLHMQVQYGAVLGSETGRFYFSNCVQDDGRLVENEPLQTGMTVEPFAPSKKLSRALTFILDDRLCYQLQRDGEPVGELHLVVKMAAHGVTYLSLDTTGDRLYFGVENNRFIFYNLQARPASPLQWMFAALPKLPLGGDSRLQWVEPLPDNVLFRRGALHGFLKSFKHSAGQVVGRYRFDEHGNVTGVIGNGNHSARTRVVFDAEKGFREIRIDTADHSYLLTRLAREQTDSQRGTDMRPALNDKEVPANV